MHGVVFSRNTVVTEPPHPSRSSRFPIHHCVCLRDSWLILISFFHGIGQYFDGVLVLLCRRSQRRELRSHYASEISILFCTSTILLILLCTLCFGVPVSGEGATSYATARVKGFGMTAGVSASVSACEGYQGRRGRLDQCQKHSKTLLPFAMIFSFLSDLWLRAASNTCDEIVDWEFYRRSQIYALKSCKVLVLLRVDSRQWKCISVSNHYKK